MPINIRFLKWGIWGILLVIILIGCEIDGSVYDNWEVETKKELPRPQKNTAEQFIINSLAIKIAPIGGYSSFQYRENSSDLEHAFKHDFLTRKVKSDDLPPIVVPLATRVLEPWTTGEAERSPEAMVLSSRVLGVCSPVSCVA